MAGPVTLRLDRGSLENFTRVLRQYRDVRKIDNAYACNRQAGQVALRAMWNTAPAARGEVEALREEYATAIRGKKRRLKTPKALYRATGRAFLIYLAQLRKTGKNPRSFANRAALMEAASKMVGRRMASIGFIRAGWIPAVRKLQSVLGKSFGSLARGRAGRGAVRVAIPADNTFAAIINKSTSHRDPDGSSRALVKYGSKALLQAIEEVRLDMLDFIEKQLAERAKPFNAAK